MNREILFRGKNLVTHEWVQGDLFQHGDQRFIMADNRNTEVIPETVGQFTGLTDENGVKIFGGDIVRRRRADGNWYNYEVLWWGNCWGIKGQGVPLVIIPLCGLQIVGNIYDDPELIGDDSNA